MQRQVLAFFLCFFFFLIILYDRVRGGSSDFFHFPKFQGGPSYIIHASMGGGGGKGGGGRQTFLKGVGVQLLRDRTCDLYLTPVPALDPRNYHKF